MKLKKLDIEFIISLIGIISLMLFITMDSLLLVIPIIVALIGLYIVKTKS